MPAGLDVLVLETVSLLSYHLSIPIPPATRGPGSLISLPALSSVFALAS